MDPEGRPTPVDLDRSWYGWFDYLSITLPPMARYEATLNPTTVTAGTTSEQTFTVTGLTTRDLVLVNKPSHQSGLALVGARVSAANTLALTFMATAAGNVDPTSESYKILAVRF